MPKLRDALKQTSGVDIGGNEFTLTETDIQPYIDEPGLIQMEADVTKARYGGSSINDPSPSGGPQATPAGKKGQPMVDFSRRNDFEQAVFNQLKSDLMPDGNPFNFNTNASLNAISKQDLPELFGQIFRNEVSWQDRHLLDDEQKKYWMSEVKRYRAHLNTALEAERETAINSYNQMMNQFDNMAKEAEAQRKRKRQTSQDLQKVKTKQSERREKREKGETAGLKRRTELLTKERELTQAVFEAEANQTLTDAEAAAFATELEGIRTERKAIEAKLKSSQIPKAKNEPTPVKDEGEPKGKDKEGSPKVVRKKVPQQGKGGKTVVKTGTYKGRKVVKYSDGSISYADEAK